MASATDADPGKPCELLLVGNARAMPEMEHLGALVAERLGAPPTLALGAFDQIGSMMRRLGVHEMSIREAERIIGAVMARVLVQPDRPFALARVARKILEFRSDPLKAAYCLLPAEYPVPGGRAIHMFASRNVHIGMAGRDPDGVYGVRMMQERPSALPDPVQVIVLSAPASGQPYAPVAFAIDFFHEASHLEIASQLYGWVLRNADIIKAGRSSGLFVHVLHSDGKFQIQQGFAQVLLESQAELVHMEMMAILGYPERDRAKAERRLAKRLIRDLRRIGPSRDFLKQEGLNASNILDWSRTMASRLSRDAKSAYR